MKREDIEQIVDKVIGFSNNLLDKLKDKDKNYKELTKGITGIITLIDKLTEIVPDNVYQTYEEFFNSFKMLSKQCSVENVLKANAQVYEESLQVYIECLEQLKIDVYNSILVCNCCGYEGDFSGNGKSELVCPNCGATSYDRLLVKFLIEHNIIEAEEGFKVIDLSGGECVESWIKYYCPQVDYQNGSVHKGKYFGADVIVSEESLCVDGKKENQIYDESGTCLFVYSDDAGGELDFAWKYEIDEEFCENGPLVSVLLPCYNHEAFVEEAILSVLNQSYKNIEFLVADDGSTDRTPEIIKRYEKHFDKCMLFKDNAFGRIFELKEQVTGKYIALMHSDDLWHKDKIALQVKFMEENPECASCLTWCRNVDQYGNKLEDQIFIQPNRDREEWMRFFWENGNALCNPSSLTRTERFYDKIWQGTTGRQLPDFFKWVDMVQHYPIHIVTKELTFMRRYQLEGVENTSIETGANSLNTHIEYGINWPFCLRDMEDEFFLSTFKDYFIHKDASTREELLCEKYFLLLSHLSPFVQNGALYFFNDFYVEMKECLDKKYNYRIREYRRDARNKGIMDLLKGVLY